MELEVVFHRLIWERKMGLLYLGYVALVNHTRIFTYDCYVGLCILVIQCCCLEVTLKLTLASQAGQADVAVVSSSEMISTAT
jgi:hypothetical protein